MEALHERDVTVRASGATLAATLVVPPDAAGVVAFAHGSGSGRFSPRNRAVAATLQRAGSATLLLDLLTEDEERLDARTGHLRFDIPLLASRLVGAIDHLRAGADTSSLPVGLFGASTGAAAALIAAAERPDAVRAVVSRGGRPDLALDRLADVRAPTLLIVGGEDTAVIGMNQAALERLGHVEARMEVVPGATHLFEEPGALERVSELASAWFARRLASGVSGN